MIDFASRADEAIVRWPTPTAREWVLRFLRELGSSPAVLAVVAMGSAVRAGVESADLDLLVVVRDGTQFQVRAPIDIDLRHYHSGALESELEDGNDLLSWAVRFGVALYDPDGCWQDLRAAWKDRVKLPDPTIAEERAARASKQLDALREAGDVSAANEVEVSCLTHLARAELSRAGVFPASRPELVAQLREVGNGELAGRLERALAERSRLTAESAAV